MQTGIPVELAARPRLAVQQSGGDSREALTLRSRGASLISALRAGVWTVTRTARWIHGRTESRRVGIGQGGRDAPAGGTPSQVSSTFIQGAHGRDGQERKVRSRSPNKGR